MLDKRISEIKGYNGDNNGFASLNCAIWGKALEDELRLQKVRLLFDVSERAFNVLLKYDKEKRNTYTKIERIVASIHGEQGLKMVQRLESKIEMYQKDLQKAVQHKIYRESLAWPNNKNRKDPEYEEEYSKIKGDVLKAFDILSTKGA
jgi:hypothetical protein